MKMRPDWTHFILHSTKKIKFKFLQKVEKIKNFGFALKISEKKIKNFEHMFFSEVDSSGVRKSNLEHSNRTHSHFISHLTDSLSFPPLYFTLQSIATWDKVTNSSKQQNVC